VPQVSFQPHHFHCSLSEPAPLPCINNNFPCLIDFYTLKMEAARSSETLVSI
jgi:hypothetical protein